MANVPGSEEIAALLRAILEPAMAGGMPEERAKAIYDDILSSIASLEELENGRTVFQWLADEIPLRFCPIFKDKSETRQKGTTNSEDVLGYTASGSACRKAIRLRPAFR